MSQRCKPLDFLKIVAQNTSIESKTNYTGGLLLNPLRILFFRATKYYYVNPNSYNQRVEGKILHQSHGEMPQTSHDKIEVDTHHIDCSILSEIKTFNGIPIIDNFTSLNNEYQYKNLVLQLNRSRILSERKGATVSKLRAILIDRITQYTRIITIPILPNAYILAWYKHRSSTIQQYITHNKIPPPCYEENNNFPKSFCNNCAFAKLCVV